MSVAGTGAERAKYDYLLQLAYEQIRALEADDMFALDRILAAKRALIESLIDAHGMMNSDPTMATIVARIQDSDKAAQRLLYRKVGRIMREMAEMQQYKKARRVYPQTARRRPRPALALLPDTPQFVDQKT